ncbi:response regulator [Gorillibacterium sp. sgz5001074]|uniref:response regulator n=1 Tax=Gorillibacterium sp. sgz5001074 TaxID=3446695 RepID=UPI003F67DD0A
MDMKKVYVVEDTEMMRFLYEFHLGQIGCTVSFYTNAGDFYAAVNRGAPDLVILDYKLKGGDNGLAVLRRIRSDWEAVPVIMVSGQLDEEARQSLQKLGVAGVLDKPVDTDLLINTVEKCLHRQEPARKPLILVLEDTEQMYRLYKICLTPRFETLHCRSAAELREAAQDGPVRLVIMDYYLHGPNEFDELLKLVQEQFPCAVRVLISGHVATLDLKTKYKHDFAAIWSKPLENVQELPELLGGLLVQNSL